MSSDLLERAQRGDPQASAQDAEDALQETLLAAWQGLAGFEAGASLRT